MQLEWIVAVTAAAVLIVVIVIMVVVIVVAGLFLTDTLSVKYIYTL